MHAGTDRDKEEELSSDNLQATHCMNVVGKDEVVG